MLAGAAIGHWWAVLLPLVFVMAVPFPDRCYDEAPGRTVCSGVAAEDLPALIVRTAPFIFAGVAAWKLAAFVRRRAVPT